MYMYILNSNVLVKIMQDLCYNKMENGNDGTQIYYLEQNCYYQKSERSY